MRWSGREISILFSLMLCGAEDEDQFLVNHPPKISSRNCDAGTEPCEKLDMACLNCSVPDCSYGQDLDLTCSPTPDSKCLKKEDGVRVKGQCLYCYQLPEQLYTCDTRQNCSTTSKAEQLEAVVCRPKPDVFCLGRRSFYRKMRCNWTSGYRWSTAFILSVTLGGFGADRFYLGLWQSGLGKLFSFGGLGVWTILDVILIGLGFVRPADGSIYII